MMARRVYCIAALAALVEVFARTAPRQLSYTQIAGYEPASDVTQHNALDVDQQEMEAYLGQSNPDFTKAKAIYEHGAHSGAYARLSVRALPAALTQRDAVLQTDNALATGVVKKGKGSGVTVVDVTYTSTCIDNVASKDYSVSGCYTMTGDVTVGGAVNIGSPLAVENRYRSLAGFSTAAGAKMVGQPVFEKFKAYYLHADYGHRYVMAALDGFGVFAGKDTTARVEGAKKGSVYLNVWMYVIREMEDAVVDCKADCINCNDDPVHAWDEAVAFYTGSLEGTNGEGSGKMLYALADKRCQNFKTCSGASTSGMSQVNKEIMKLFQEGQIKLLQGKCDEVPAIMRAIVQHMCVPLIQGALRYAYKVGELQGGSKAKAEGAAFAAAVLPLVNSCKPAAATLIAKNMNIDESAPMTDGFAAVKNAFESAYSCLGITCAQVGGHLMTPTAYHEGAGPCGNEEPSSSSVNPSNPSTAGKEIEANAASPVMAASLSTTITCIAFIWIFGGLW